MQPLDWHKKRMLSDMSITAELILNILNNEGPLTVMDALGSAHSKSVASMTTIHGGLKWLKDHSYIKIQVSTTDHRIKLCVITPKGHKYLEEP